MSPPRFVSKNETPIRRSISLEARRLEIFPLRPSVITCGCSHSSKTSGMAPALRAAATRRCSSHAAPYSTSPRSTTNNSFMASGLSTSNFRLSTLFRCKDALDLAQMIEIVPGMQVNDVLDSFDAALGVQSVILPLLCGKGLQQRQVCFPCNTKLLQRFSRVALLIVARGGPGVLVKRLDRRSGRAPFLPP